MFGKPKTLIVAIILVGFTFGSVGASLAAAGHEQDHGAGRSEKLQSEVGKRWATDAPLRRAMGSINQSVKQVLPAIHDDRLPSEQYGQLAENIRVQVAYMIDHCKLSAGADAQLHLIIRRLLAGADTMAGTTAQRDGALTVVGALGDYARYFIDDSFAPVGS